ncbi:hypothetical protein PENTCL1PPCAC_18794, partial [Pristionchus entomophagus]
IDKVTLVFDKKTLSNINKVPTFLSSVHAKNVEFVLERPTYNDMLTSFMDDGFSAEFVKAGICEVTFSANENGENKKM